MIEIHPSEEIGSVRDEMVDIISIFVDVSVFDGIVTQTSHTRIEYPFSHADEVIVTFCTKIESKQIVKSHARIQEYSCDGTRGVSQNILSGEHYLG
jgi:hypothetical protein